MMSVWASYLRKLCGLCLKDRSHEVICANPRITNTEVLDCRGVRWKKVGHMVSLGQCIACNGSTAEDRKRLGRSWEAAFWRNSNVLLCKQITFERPASSAHDQSEARRAAELCNSMQSLMPCSCTSPATFQVCRVVESECVRSLRVCSNNSFGKAAPRADIQHFAWHTQLGWWGGVQIDQ